MKNKSIKSLKLRKLTISKLEQSNVNGGTEMSGQQMCTSNDGGMFCDDWWNNDNYGGNVSVIGVGSGVLPSEGLC